MSRSGALKTCSLSGRGGGCASHNLNIQMYTFPEILALFNLENTSTITEENMRQSKQIVLRMHPDKSRLPSSYFVFYKKAYEILYIYYQSQVKVETNAPKTKIQYDPNNLFAGKGKLEEGGGGGGADSDPYTKEVKSVLGEMKAKDFQQRFHQLYEENMVDKERTQRAQDRNQWFTQEDPIYKVDTKGLNKDTIHRKVDELRREAATNYLTQYRGVQTLSSFGGGVHTERLWDDQEEEGESGYVTTDPFSKLKFDDLRRVHKDQTVFMVDESQYDNMPKYTNVDQYNRARNSVDLKPLEKTEAQRRLQEQEDMLKARQAKYQQDMIMKTRLYEEKNKNVMSQFLRLT
jgi:hypothetical protein